MLTSLLSIAGLCAVCSLTSLSIEHQQRYAIVPEGSNQEVYIDFYEDYDGLIGEHTVNYAYTHQGRYFSNTESFATYRNATGIGASFINLNGVQNSQFINPFILAEDLSSDISHIMLSSIYEMDDTINCYFTFAVNTSFVTESVSSNGCFLTTQFAFDDYYFDKESINVNIYRCDSSIFPRYSDWYDYSQAPGSIISLENFGGSTLDAYIGNDYRYNSIVFDEQFTYWKPDANDYVTRPMFSISTGFPNVITNGISVYDRSFYWNHLVYRFSFNKEDGVPDSIQWPSYNGTFDISARFVGYSSSYAGDYGAGYSAGYQDGLLTGQSQSYQEGYDAGYNVGVQSGNTSWRGLFGSIADTPVLMIRSLFNFDLFGMNVLYVVMSLITAIFLFYIIKKVLL